MSAKYSLGPLEKQVIEIIWQEPKKKFKVAQIQEKLKAKGISLAYTTIMTILTRLTQKELLKRSYEGRAYYYQVKCKKQSFVKKLVKQTLKNLTQNYGDVALAAFAAEISRLTPEEKTKLIKKLRSS